MLKVYYDPLNGHAVPDAIVPIYVQGIIGALATEEGKQGDVTRTISTGLIIDELRLQILLDKLNPEDLVVIYNDEELHFTNYAVPAEDDRWIPGMFEYTDDLVSRVLRAQCNRSKKAKQALEAPQ